MKKLICLLSVGFLTQCSIYQEEFECPYGKGVGCKATEAVDKMIDQGAFAEEGEEEGLSGSLNSESKETRPAQIRSGSLSGKQVIRAPEKTMTVWLAPFQDKGGNLYQETTVHTVVEPGYWKEMG